MVSIHRGREHIFEVDKIKPSDIARYVRENKDLLKQKENYVGAWHDPSSGKVFLDVSVRATSSKDVSDLGRSTDSLPTST